MKNQTRKKMKKRRRNRERLPAVYDVLVSLGGIATTPKIQKRLNELGYSCRARYALKRLQVQGYVKSDSPYGDENATLRWEIIKKYSANT